jgi:hypothetical protein
MPADLKEKTVGLCGTWDNDASNDWQDINFKNHDLPNFVNSWVDTSIAGRTFRKFNFTNPNSKYSIRSLQQTLQHQEPMRR